MTRELTREANRKAKIIMLVGVDWGGTKIEAIAMLPTAQPHRKTARNDTALRLRGLS